MSRNNLIISGFALITSSYPFQLCFLLCLACIILSYCTQLPSFIWFFSVIFQFLSLLFSWISLILTSSKWFPNMSLVLSCFSKLPPLASLPFPHCIHRSAHVYTHLMSVHTQRYNTPTSSFVQYLPPQHVWR